MIEWGPQVKALEREAERGRSIPALENRPDLEPHLIWVWEAYSTLDKSRQWGAGFPQPISLVELESYARLNRIRRAEVDELIRTVQHLDACYLERMAQRKKGQTT